MKTTIKNEYLLQYIWNLRLLPQRGIYTTCKREIRIVHPGQLNLNDGPDFLDAEILIENEIWFGHVEIHINSSDWIAHGHNEDPRYENVVLHVVLDHDCDIHYPDNSVIPTLEIRKILPKNFTSTYLTLIYNSKNLPCTNLQSAVSDLHFSKWIETLAIERMENKVTRFLDSLKEALGDWEECIYRTLMIGMGGRINKQGFETLAENIPLKMIRHHSSSPQELEILLLGQAGLLEDLFDDENCQNITSTFNHFKAKYGLEPMKPQLWYKKGVRPANQPATRIRQFCTFLHDRQYFLDTLLELRNKSEYCKFFESNIQLSNKSIHKIGAETIEILLINSIAPIIFAYGKMMQIHFYCERAIDLWSNIKSEKNKITRQWEAMGRKALTALDSQALNQLESNYCVYKRCHQCAIGHFIMRKSQVEDIKILYKREKIST